MNKPIFAALASAAIIASCAPAQEAPSREFGIQLYSVRTVLSTDGGDNSAIYAALSEAGYSSVEAANYGDRKFYGRTPEEFKADLEAAGLTAISSHTFNGLLPWEIQDKTFAQRMAWWDDCIADHKAAGMKYIVCPAFGVPGTLEELDFYCQYFNAIGAKCKEAGLEFGIHNHSHEFQKIEGEVMYDYMLSHTDPELVFFQMDVYWTMRAGASPVSYFKAYPGRFKMLHLKDDTELGQSGMVGFDAILSNTDVAGTCDYIVEQEGTSVGDILEGVKISAEYLKNNNFGFGLN